MWEEGQATPHGRLGTQEGFLGEEALGQGLAEGESGGRSSSSFLPPPHSFPRPTQSSPLGALPPQQAPAFLPVPVSSWAWASPAQQPPRGTEGRQPHRHTA